MQLRALLYQLFFLWLFALPLLLPAQTFRFTQYTTHEGLPIDNVYAAAQDGNGFIWFATDFGIARFDGYRFQVFNKKNGMNNNAVTDITYAGGDSLVFFSYPTTIQSIHYDGRINTIIQNAFISLQQLTRHNDEYYCLNRNEGNFGLLKNGVYKIILADSFFNAKGVVVNAIVSLNEKGIAFCTTKGLYIKNNDQVTLYLADKDVDNVLFTTQKTLLAVSNNQVIEADADFIFHPLPYIFPKGFMTLHMVSETDGTCWFRGLDKWIYRLQNNKLEEMSSRLGLQNKVVNEFFTDQEQNLWFCTDGSGILFKKKSAFINYETQDGLVNNKIIKLYKNKNDLFIGTSNGLSIKREEIIRPVKLPIIDVGLKYVQRLLPISDADVGICINNSFIFSKDPLAYEFFIKQYKIENIAIKAFNGLFAWEQSKDNLWLTNGPNLVHLVNKKIASQFGLLKMGNRKVFDMISYDNKIWVAANGGLFTVNDSNYIKQDVFGNKKSGQVFQFLIDKSNRLWIATESGLFIYENDLYRQVVLGNTIGSNYCKSIVTDNDNKIWCATWDGIFVTDGVTTTNYNTTEGLLSKTTNCILFDSSEDKLYIGSDNGLSVINKKDLTNPTYSGKIFINGSYADTVDILNGSDLPTGQRNLSFYLSVPYFHGNTGLQYEYKLDNDAWTRAKSPAVFISGISSGKHKLYARARKNGQVFTKEDAVFSFTIPTPFYKTWWFWLLAALLLQFIIFRFINQYNKRAREKKLAVLQQQAEYASLKQQAFTSLMNPHFIFNALNSVQHYINQQDRQSANKYLSDFATLVRKSFETAQRSFVSLEEELETVRLYLQLEKMRFTDKFDYLITLSKDVEDDEWMLPSMVLQPFLENAILHGLMPLNSKGLITIDAMVKKDVLYITITDNGIGIEKSKIYRSGKEHKSRGMHLIKERLQLLSKLSKEPIELVITALNPAAENPGTKISIVIPQSVYMAFQQQPGQK